MQGGNLYDQCREYVLRMLPFCMPHLYAWAILVMHIIFARSSLISSMIYIFVQFNFRYNFNKVAQYKQLTLEEAEEKMKNRRRTADGYERWMMKAANNGAAAFGEVEKFDDKEAVAGGGRGRKKTGGDDDEAHVSDRGEEDEDEEAARKNRLQLNKKSGDDDEEGPRGGDLDMDDDDIEKGEFLSHSCCKL